MIAESAAQVESLRESLAVLLERQSPGRPPRASSEALGELPFDSAFADRCRVAVHRLVGLEQEGVIMVSSPQRKEGRSSVAAAAASVLARARGTGRSLLLDLDFKRSSQAHLFSVAPTPGLGDYLEDREPLRAITGGSGCQLSLIPAGNHLGDAGRLIHQVGQGGLLPVFREYFDWVVIDAPPILSHPEVSALAPLVDWHIVVGRHRRTLVAELNKVRQLIGDAPAGFLLTSDSSRIPGWIRRLL